MPLGRGLLDRIRQYTQPGTGAATDPTVSPGPQPGLIQRLKDRTLEYLEQRLAPQRVPQMAPSQRPAAGLSEIKQRIIAGGRTRTKVHLLYLGKWRMCSPYSFRYRDKDLPHIPLVFVFEDGSPTIKSFKLWKTADARNTDLVFDPRWTVEL